MSAKEESCLEGMYTVRWSDSERDSGDESEKLRQSVREVVMVSQRSCDTQSGKLGRSVREVGTVRVREVVTVSQRSCDGQSEKL